MDHFVSDHPVAVQPAATTDGSSDELHYAYQGSHDALIHRVGAYRTGAVVWSTFGPAERDQAFALLEEGGYDTSSLRDWFATYPDGWLVLAMASHSNKMPKGVG